MNLRRGKAKSYEIRPWNNGGRLPDGGSPDDDILMILLGLLLEELLLGELGLVLVGLAVLYQLTTQEGLKKGQ